MKAYCPQVSCTRLRRYFLKLTSCNLKPVIACAAIFISAFGTALILLYLQAGRLDLKDAPGVKGTPMSHVSLKLLEQALANITNATTSQQDAFDTYETVYQLYTSGCEIPLVLLNFNGNRTNNTALGTCGRRAVFLRRSLYDDQKVLVSIYKSLLNVSNTTKRYSCCYRYITSNRGKEHKTQYTPCIKIRHAEVITLQSDFINVKCLEINKSNESITIYQDYYGFAKKVEKKKPVRFKGEEAYNVLMVGIDSMSMSHFAQSFPRSFSFVKENFWLRYPGFHKTAQNKLQNLLAILTGSDFMAFNQTCLGEIEACKDQFIWSQFKDAGYVTAYGEDYLRAGETFNSSLKFYEQPTDHYARPLFYGHEHEIDGQGLVCSGKISSSQLLLDYAIDFANTYRNDSYFGLFWINSFSNEMNIVPTNADKILENFFNSLTYMGILKNTFIILFSAHGVRSGQIRMKSEGYYDERLPLLCIWTPWQFQATHAKGLRYAALNQMSLVTLYDLYNTLVGIRNWAYNMTAANYSTACTHCVSIYEPIPWTRTCADVALGQQWCSCHNLYPLDIQDSEGINSVFFAVAHINSKVAAVRTKKCWSCARLRLSKVIRIHFYYIKKVLYYVVAFAVLPANMTYEAVISKNGKVLNMVGEVNLISSAWENNTCSLQQSEFAYCVCQLVDNCQT